MRIGLITTLDTNIGDDLIRMGVCLLLREVFKGQGIEFVPINKHEPLSVYPTWHPVHLTALSEYLPIGGSRARSTIEGFMSKVGLTLFDACDLVVQCGAPVLWPGCHRSEWADSLWHHIVGRLYQKIPVLDLAAGSCYPWERQPTSISDPEEAYYIRRILRYCRLTTVRDNLAQRIFASLGTETPLIPCCAFMAAKGYTHSNKRETEVVLINYMSGGGHYDWNQGVNPVAWSETVRTLINRLRLRHSLAFLCHNQAEYHLARELDPSLPRLWPKNTKEYFTLISRTKAALCNRMHASVGLASLGIPSIAVCTDTRLLMVSTLGLTARYVKEANAQQLEEDLETLLKDRTRERHRLLSLRSETWNTYIRYISDAISPV